MSNLLSLTVQYNRKNTGLHSSEALSSNTSSLTSQSGWEMLNITALKYKKETVRVAFYDDNELNEIRVIQVYYGCSINISFPSLTLALTYVFSFWLWGWSFNLKCRAKSISNRTLTLWSKIHTEKNFSVDDLTESLRLADTTFPSSSSFPLLYLVSLLLSQRK